MKMSTKILTFSPNVSLSVVGMSASELFKLFAFVLFPRSRELVLNTCRKIFGGNFEPKFRISGALGL